MLSESEKKTESSGEDQLVEKNLSHTNTQNTETVKRIHIDHPKFITTLFKY